MTNNQIRRLTSHMLGIQQFKIFINQLIKTQINSKIIKQKLLNNVFDKNNLLVDNFDNKITKYLLKLNPETNENNYKITAKTYYDEEEYTSILEFTIHYVYDLTFNDGNDQIYLLYYRNDYADKNITEPCVFDKINFFFSVSFVLDNKPEFDNYEKLNNIDGFTSSLDIFLSSSEKTGRVDIWSRMFTEPDDLSFYDLNQLLIHFDTNIINCYFDDLTPQNPIDDIFILYPTLLPTVHTFIITIDDYTIKFNDFVYDIIQRLVEINNKSYKQNIEIHYDDLNYMDKNNKEPTFHCYHFTGFEQPSKTCFVEDEFSLATVLRTIDINEIEVDEFLDKMDKLKLRIKSFNLKESHIMTRLEYNYLINDFATFISYEIDDVDRLRPLVDRIRTVLDKPSPNNNRFYEPLY